MRRASLAIGIACAVVLLGTAAALARPGLGARLGWAKPGAASYAVGTYVDLEPAFYQGKTTVVLFSRANCEACRRSKATLAAIVADVAKRSDVQVTFVTPTTSDQEETDFARDIGVPPSRHLAIDLSTLRLKHVPALVLVDERGTVILAHDGVGIAERQELAARLQ